MKLLVNYDRNEQAYLPILQYHLRQKGYQAIATSTDLTLAELLQKAKNANCDAIFLCNPNTLFNCVPGAKPTLDDYRGSRLNFSVPAIVGNSLKHSHTVDHGSWLLQKDLDKFKHITKPIEEFSFKVLETQYDMDMAVQTLETAILIAYDIETATINEDEEKLLAGDTLITCCTWSALLPSGNIVNYVLPILDFMVEHWTNDADYAYAIATLRRINKLPIPKVMHNGKYDCLHSIVYHAEPYNWVLDTLAMAYSEYSSLPKTLDFTSSITLYDYCQWKSESAEASKAKDIQRYWAYNARDGFNTLRVCLHYLRNLPPYARKNYQQLFKLVYPALYCDFEGILIDQDKRNELRAKHIITLDENLKGLQTFVGDKDFNPSSPTQVATYVYDIFGATDPHIGKKKDAKTGHKSKKQRGTDEKNLKAVGDQHPLLLRLTNRIIAYREARKAVSTYFDFLQKNGRLLYSINPFGTTDTGRMSCVSSGFWCGTQAQNVPSYAKAMLIADTGYVIEEVDKSQSEARCTAYLSKEVRLITALETPGKDFYKSLGTLFFAMPYETVTKEFRNLVLKKIVHGTNYMMGADTFIENAGIENLLFAASILDIKVSLKKVLKKEEVDAGFITMKHFASTLLEAYHKPFFRVREWYAEVKHEVKTTHMLTSPLGYTRYFFGDIDKKYQIFSSAVAHGPQNLSVMILNKGFWNVWQLVKQYKGALRMKAQVHDSILYQRNADREDIRLAVLKAVNTPALINGKTLLIPNDIKVGNSWGDMEELPRIVIS